MTLVYGSVCSGIEAATSAWHPLGWRPSFFSEIEPFPRAVLAHHYPDVPLHGDFTTIEADQYEPIDLLVGGTPCQSFSIAGLRGGLDDDRGNLALEFLRLADRLRPRWVVWENVPGVLSSGDGRDFGSILGGLVELGYGFAYRVLDAQYFGVAQRRRRVFVVGYFGDAARAAAVLFERHSLSGHSAPRRSSPQDIAGTFARSSYSGGASGRPEGAAANHFVAWPAEVAPTLNASFGSKMGLENQHIAGGGAYSSIAKCLTTGVGQRYDPETETLIPTHGCVFDEDVICFEANMSLQPPSVGQVYPTITRRTHAAIVSPSCLDVSYAIQAGALRSNPTSGPDGVGVQEGHAYTLEARSEVQAVAYSIMPMNSGKDYKARETEIAQPIMASGPGGNQGGDFVCQPPVIFQPRIGRNGRGYSEGVVPALNGADAGATSDMRPCVAHDMMVRRLTPVECERLQGFPDNYTAIPWRKRAADECPDGPRYKALGNSMAVPVMRWIGERIRMVEEMVA